MATLPALVVPPTVETLSADMVGIMDRVAAVTLELLAPPMVAVSSTATASTIRTTATLVVAGLPHPRLVRLRLQVVSRPLPALVPVLDQPRVS